MTWDYLGILRLLVLIFCHQVTFGATSELPDEWSSISSSAEAVSYPETEHEIARARVALQGDGNDIRYDFESSPTPYGAGIKGKSYRWPGYPGSARIPYVIHSSVRSLKKLIFQAMNQYRKNTCIDFVPRKKQKDYIRFIHGRGCSSFIGRLGGRQDVTLGDGCGYVGTIAHEIGHVVGMYHEHQRSDRSDYLKIFLRNVISGEEHNFDKTPRSEEYLLTPFNYNSIMIYGNYAFSKSPDKLKTMVLKNKKLLKEPYEKPGLDNTDIKEVNKLYECHGTANNNKNKKKKKGSKKA